MINIRAATSADAKLIFDLIVELAVYEKAPHEVVTDENGISDSLFGPTARAKALVCEVDGRAVGYAVYFYSYSTWLGRSKNPDMNSKRRKRGSKDLSGLM